MRCRQCGKRDVDLNKVLRCGAVETPSPLEKLLEGVRQWNEWRKAHPEIERPDLRGVDFTADEYQDKPLYTKDAKGHFVANLRQADLHGSLLLLANLQGADIHCANLEGADLTEANLQGADLMAAELQGAELGGAKLQGAVLRGADLQGAKLGLEKLGSAGSARLYAKAAILQGADLRSAQLQDAGLRGADLRGAFLQGANLEGADVTDVKFLLDSRQHAFRGIRVSTCYGNQIFKTFAQDQDYIETLRASGPCGAFKFWIWYILADCGRSFLRWAGWSILFAMLFGFVYYWMGPRHFDIGVLKFKPLTMIYYSVITFTTLGFGDIKPITDEGLVVVILEVILGYIMLGGLVAIFANKVARRA